MFFTRHENKAGRVSPRRIFRLGAARASSNVAHRRSCRLVPARQGSGRARWGIDILEVEVAVCVSEVLRTLPSRDEEAFTSAPYGTRMEVEAFQALYGLILKMCSCFNLSAWSSFYYLVWLGLGELSGVCPELASVAGFV